MGLGFLNRLKFGGGEAAITDKDFSVSTTENKEKKEKSLVLDIGSSVAISENSENQESGDQALVVKASKNSPVTVLGVFDTVNENKTGPQPAKIAKNFFKNNFAKIFSGKEKPKTDEDLPNYKSEMTTLFSEAAKNGAEQNPPKGSRTTATVLGLTENVEGKDMTAVVGNVGDSAVFVLEDGELKKITQENHKSVITLPGGRTQTEFSKILSFSKLNPMRSAGMSVPEVATFKVKSGSVILLATDGIAEKLSLDQIKELLTSSENSQQIAEKFIEAGYQNADRAAVVVKIKDPEYVVPAKNNAPADTVLENLPSVQEKKAQQAAPEITKEEKQKWYSVVKNTLKEAKNYLPSLPKVKMPNFSMPKVSMPEFNMPKLPNVKMPEVKMPKFERPGFLKRNKTEQPKEPEKQPVEVNVEKELQKPAVERKIGERVMVQLKNLRPPRLKEIVYSAGAGAAVRIGAKLIMETLSFGAKTAVAAAAGGATSGVGEYFKQKREADEHINKFVEELSSRGMPDIKSGNAQMFMVSETLIELAGKKQRGEKMTVKDFKEFLKIDMHAAFELSDKDAEVRNEILEEIEKLKIDKMKIAVAAAQGAVAGAIGSMVVGEIIEFGSSHNWFNVDEKAKDFIAWAKKGLSGFGEPHNPGAAGSLTKEIFKQPIPALEQVPELKVPEAAVPDLTQNQTLASEYKEILKQKLYLFNSDRVESLTKASRGLIHDYLNNETLLKTSLGKENLSIQQMVYAEDYLRKSLEKMQILPGKRIEVSGRLIAEAVEKARSLTEAQIDNLTILINSPENKLGKAARKLMESQDYSSQLNDFRQLFGAKPDGSKIVGLLIVDAVK
jgi:serine/threonine protein phosphatase PrpC